MIDRRHRSVPRVLATALLACGLRAQGTATPEPARKSPEGPLEDLGLLHRGQKGDVCNEWWVLGRYHGHYHWSEGSLADDEGFESRRARFGTQVRFFDDLTIHAQAISGNDLEPTYNGFSELWVSWRFDDAFVLSVGQQKNRFTHDRNASSRYLNYLERSQLTNMFGADYTPAVTLQGRASRFQWYGGVFSNKATSDMVDTLFELDSGYSLLGLVTYDLGKGLGTDTAFVSLSTVHSDANANATNLNYFDHGYALCTMLTEGSASLVTEVTSGLGNPRGDALGLNLQPGLFVTDRLQFVGRYQFALSDEEQGLRAQRRYERDVGLTTGDHYQAVYLGLNHHFYGHRMKVLTGAEWSTLGGEDVWTFSVSFRVFFGPHSRGPFPMDGMLPGLL